MEVRDKKLYRASHGTFEAYCKERWGMNRAHAYRLIESAEVTDNLSPMGDIPKTERQTRPLTKLEPDQQREAWDRATKTAPGGKVTAKHVKAVVQEMKEESMDVPVPIPTTTTPRPEYARDFDAAFEAFLAEITNAKALKWRYTPKEKAVQCAKILHDVITH